MLQVYALIDPRSNKVRYVGLSKDANRRYKSHLARPMPTTAQWLSELKALELVPALALLEEVEEGDGLSIENEWIFFYQRIHGHLLNRRSDFPRTLKSKVIDWRKHREALTISPVFSIEHLERRLERMNSEATSLEKQIEILRQRHATLTKEILELKENYDPQKVAAIHDRVFYNEFSVLL